MGAGFVYLLSNSAMDGLVKIGKSTKVPTERASELQTTGVPTPFEVLLYLFTHEMDSFEEYLHTKLKEHRVASNREFFKINYSTILNEIRGAPFEHTIHYNKIDNTHQNETLSPSTKRKVLEIRSYESIRTKSLKKKFLNYKTPDNKIAYEESVKADLAYIERQKTKILKDQATSG